jgi:general secretion pathway protein D
MKSVTNLCILLGCAVMTTAQDVAPKPETTTPEEPAPTAETSKEAPKYAIRRGHNMQGEPLNKLLEEYALLTGKTLIVGKNLPKVTFDFKANNDLTHEESKAFYETLMMQQQIAVVPQGEKFIKVIAAAEVVKTPPTYFPNLEYDVLPDSELPVMGSYTLKNLDPASAVDLVTPMAKTPNAVSIVAGSDVLFIRDSAVNVKRMLLMLEQVDVEIAVKEEYELIKIRYALSADIAAVLATLTNTPRTGTTGSRNTTSGRTTGSTANRTTGSTANRTTGSTGSGRTSGGSSSLANRLSQIRGGSGTGVSGVGLPILGDTQVVSYQRGNEVLLIGTRRHLDRAKSLIEKLDTLQPQVLIEAIIIDVALGDDKTFGVSLRQNKNVIATVPDGEGGKADLSSALASSLGPAGFTETSVSGAASGFNYWGFLGNSWEIAVNAIQNDSRVTMHSRPRIQTSHAELAELFIGDTRPVVTGTITDISGGTSSQYQMQKFGITLNVVPFINEEGLVVMELEQQIQDIVGSQTINGNAVPIVTDRSANAKIAVRDGEMIVLGGFIKTKTTTYEDGVPVLRDIPLLGKLFEKTQDIDERNELIVLMRPTVLKTPEAAAIKAVSEQANLPGIDLAKDEEKRLQEKYRKLVEEIRMKRNGGVSPEDSIPGNLKDQPLVPELPE